VLYLPLYLYVGGECTRARFGETISIIVSGGPESVAIPDVRGVPVAQARQQLEGLGFVVTTSEEPSQDVAEGQVIRTEPQGEAPPGSTVNVVVSVGDTVTVPDVTQADVDEAVEALTAVGLAPNEPIALDCETIQSQDASFDCDAFPDEGVYFTDPLAGAVVDRGSAIDIVYYDDDL
jgi:beta-lactam-binding protein with PASTA domain